MILKPIYYKEYLKIRWPWLSLAALNGLLMAYIYVETRRLFAMDHAEIVWYRVMHLGWIHYEDLKYAPMLTGLLVGCIQYLPEMVDERLRLSLHLPVSPHRLILAHILVGLTAVGLVLGMDLSVLALITARYFPVEVVSDALLTALPWGLAGPAAYLGATLGLLEPGYRLRICNLAIAAGVAGFFLYPADPGGYQRVLPFLGLAVLIMIPAVLLPAYRFRFRRVS
jgi:hypothetical protein